MITVTLGTIPYPFNRAIQWLRFLLDTKIISESVFVQYGVSDISPVFDHDLVTAKPLLESKELMKIVDDSRLVISHAGQGSTTALASRGACFVILPRLAKYSEHIDDHQLSFARSVEQFGVVHCLTLKELEQVIFKPPLPFQRKLFEEPKLADHLSSIYSKRSTLIVM
ncbi:MAG: glycosyl transferase [Moorea sp. SIO2I5]|nr:glycosyl transferase [Moorena sp. SIO2I5]